MAPLCQLHSTVACEATVQQAKTKSHSSRETPLL